MRTPFSRALPSRISLQAACVCYALCGAPAAALAAPEKIVQTPVVSTPASAAPKSSTSSPNRRVFALVAVGCLVGVVVGWVTKRPRETRFRLLNKPKKMPPAVLVPPKPAPRLIPRDSPNATRPRSMHAPIPPPTPVRTTRTGVIDYIAVFSESPKAGADTRLDYVLVASDDAEEHADPR